METNRYYLSRENQKERKEALLGYVSADTFLSGSRGEGRLRESITVPLPRRKGLRLYE